MHIEQLNIQRRSFLKFTDNSNKYCCTVLSSLKMFDLSKFYVAVGRFQFQDFFQLYQCNKKKLITNDNNCKPMFQITNVRNDIKANSKNPQIKLQNKIITIYFANTIMQN